MAPRAPMLERSAVPMPMTDTPRTAPSSARARKAAALRATAIYLAISLAWIALSDRWLESFEDVALARVIGAFKGLLFAVVTAAVLYVAFASAPPDETTARRRSIAGSSVALLLLAVLALGIGAIAYHEQRTRLVRDVAADLDTETSLKAQRVATLLDARRMQAAGLAGNPLAARAVQAWIARGDAGSRRLVEEWLRASRRNLGLDALRLFAPDGRDLLAAGALAAAPAEPADVRAAASSGRIVLEDLHRDGDAGPVHLAFAAPIVDAEPPEHPVIAVVVLESGVEADLFPVVSSRVDETRSGESYLVRRDAAGGIAFLTPLHGRPGSALDLRADAVTAPLIEAALAGGSTVRGADYRGETVFMRAAPVAGTGWWLVTQIDESEAFAPLQRSAWTIAGLLLISTAFCALLARQLAQRARLRRTLVRLRQAQALEALERRFERLFDNSSVGMAVLTLDGRFLRVNPTLCEMTGYGEAELLERRYTELAAPEGLQDALQRQKMIVEGTVLEPYEERCLRKDGRVIWVALNPSLVRDVDGRPAYLIAVVRDVTQERRAEEALRLSEERFELAMRGAQHAVWDWSLADEAYFSSSWKAMLGYEDGEIANRIASYEALLHPDDRALLRAAVGRVERREAATFEMECRMRHKDGRYLDILSRAYPVYAEGGRLRRLVGTQVNVTERKAIETAMRERITLQEYIDRLAGTLPGSLYSFRRRPDGSYCMPYTAPPFEAMFGVRSEEVVDDMTRAFTRVHPADLPALVASIEASWRDGTPWHCEFRIRRPGGEIAWVEGRSLPQREADGGTIWHGFLHDVSERKQQELRLRQAATVFAGTHEGVVVTDPQGAIIAVNPAFQQITGYDEPELLGRNMRVLRSGRQDGAFYADLWQAVARQGYWQGELWNRRKNGELYPEWLTVSAVRDDAGEVVNYIGTFSDITRLKESEAQLEHLAHHDPLTGLPNRLLLREQLDLALLRSRRSGQPGALLMLDLDRFKNVNDSLGHAAGDELLVMAARRLREHLRAGDLLGRLGGDEFVVVLEDLPHADDAARVARTLIECIGQPFALHDAQQAYVGLSIGISLFPGDGDQVGDLIQHADAAMYRAKNAGRGTFCFYSAAMTDEAASRLALEARLRRALEREELELHYQPLVDLASGRLRGVEALARWTDGDAGPVSPSQFIPLAEDTGMIVALGEWVLRRACTQMAQWRRAGLPLKVMAVNLSPRQLALPDIDARVAAILAETGLPPAALELEITEGALDGDALDIQEKIRRLKALGLRIAIDDFGTGYSSLLHLKRFPIDKLKIDRAFVRDVPGDTTDAEIVTAIIALGKILGMEVLAEGVENATQLQFLLRHGCLSGQGFLFGRAARADEIVHLVTQRPEACALPGELPGALN